MCVLPRAGSTFPRMYAKVTKKSVLRAGGPDEKEQMVRTMHELKAVVHAVVSPAGLLEAKNAPMER